MPEPRPQEILPTDQITITSFHGDQVSRHFQRALWVEGISPSQDKRNHKFYASVDNEDRQTALDIFPKHAEQHPDVKPAGIRREFDYLFLGVVIGRGTAISLISAVVSHHSTYTPFWSIGAIATLLGGLVGNLIDRLWRNVRLSGRLQPSFVDYLLLMGACATIFHSWFCD